MATTARGAGNEQAPGFRVPVVPHEGEAKPVECRGVHIAAGQARLRLRVGDMGWREAIKLKKKLKMWFIFVLN
jgi:hypothetical protein